MNNKRDVMYAELCSRQDVLKYIQLSFGTASLMELTSIHFPAYLSLSFQKEKYVFFLMLFQTTDEEKCKNCPICETSKKCLKILRDLKHILV